MHTYAIYGKDTSLQLLLPRLLQCSFGNTSCLTFPHLLQHNRWTYFREESTLCNHTIYKWRLYLTTVSPRRYSTNLSVQVVLFFSVFVLKTRICPVLAQPVPNSSRRPLVCCKAINQAFLFYTAQYHEGNSSEFPSVWVA